MPTTPRAGRQRAAAARATAAPLPLLVLVALGVAPDADAQGTSAPPAGQPGVVQLRRFALSGQPLLAAEGTLGPVERDASNGGAAAGDGGPLTVNGEVFATGFGARAPSVLAFQLGGRASVFRASVGIDDSAGPGATANFQVVVDGVVAFQSGQRDGNDAALSTGLVDVRGAHELLLVARDGGDGFANDLVDWCDPTVLAIAPPTADDAPVRATRGSFSAPTAWPVEAIHASLLADGRVVSHASVSATSPGDPSPAGPHGSTRVDVFDPATGTHTPFDHPTEDIVGAAHARRSDGALLSLGGYAGSAAGSPIGADQASAFGPPGSSWRPAAPMSRARYGAAAVTLGGGEVLALGGAHASAQPHAPELLQGEAWCALTGVDTQPFLAVGDPDLDRTFPRVHLAPDGRVLLAGWDQRMVLIDPRGTGRIDFSANREPIQRAWGTSTLLRGGEVLLTGGVNHLGDPTRLATSSTAHIALGGANPTASSGIPMLFPRADHDATILADGRLLVTGGGAQHTTSAGETSVRVAELYDPTTGRWDVAAQEGRARGEGSTALLLPDARVLVAGGDPQGPTASFYSPPYLFAPDGSPAARPAITSAPGRVAYGETFGLNVSGPRPVARVTFVRLGSAARGVNNEQRFLDLAFTDAGGGALQVDAPLRGADAPPGSYMLFAIDSAGVPSTARIVGIGRPRPSAWEFLQAGGPAIAPRHESAAVAVGGKLYLIGGRGSRPTQEFDPATNEWRSLGPTPFELHHFQPVVVDGLVYVVGAFTGGYPNESNVANVWTFDPADESWTIGAAVPSARRRGSAGAVVYDGRIWLVGGNSQGHNGGARPWFDVYDPRTNAWTQLPDAPRARDHASAVVVGHRLVFAGGRRTTQPNPFVGTVGEVDVYDFANGQWSTLASDLPTERAGALTLAHGRHVVVIGGESPAMLQAHRDVEALDVFADRWVTLPDLRVGRHSGGAALLDGLAHVVSGSGNRGGSPELSTAEVLDLRSGLIGVQGQTNLVPNAGFDAGIGGWDVSGDVVLVEDGGVAAPGARVGVASSLSRTAPATAGTTYRVRVLHRTDSASGTAGLRVSFEDAGGAVLNSVQKALPTTAGPPELEQLQTVAPSGAVRIRVEAYTVGARTTVVDDFTARSL